MLKALIAWLQSLFTRGPAVRTPAAATVLRRSMQDRVDNLREGHISCPWHQESGMSCAFNKTTRTVHCAGCGRSTDLAGLLYRLRAPDVYQRAVE